MKKTFEVIDGIYRKPADMETQARAWLQSGVRQSANAKDADGGSAQTEPRLIERLSDKFIEGQTGKLSMTSSFFSAKIGIGGDYLAGDTDLCGLVLLVNDGPSARLGFLPAGTSAPSPAEQQEKPSIWLDLMPNQLIVFDPGKLTPVLSAANGTLSDSCVMHLLQLKTS